MSNLYDFPIVAWRTQFALRSMLETGTYKGKSVMAALDAGFRHIVTCEIEESFTLPVRKFIAASEHYSSASIAFLVGDTTKKLPEMLSLLPLDPALIFLDAHVHPSLFDGAVNVEAYPRLHSLPLRREIEMLLSLRDIRRDVIVIDDMHLNVHERWVGVEWAKEWRLPLDESSLFPTVDALAKMFPQHTAREERTLSALTLMPEIAR